MKIIIRIVTKESNNRYEELALVVSREKEKVVVSKPSWSLQACRKHTGRGYLAAMGAHEKLAKLSMDFVGCIMNDLPWPADHLYLLSQ